MILRALRDEKFSSTEADSTGGGPGEGGPEGPPYMWLLKVRPTCGLKVRPDMSLLVLP